MAGGSIDTYFTCDQSEEQMSSSGLHDSETEDQILHEGTVLLTNTSSFIVKGCKGKGVYGRVAHCIEVSTNTPVAIKMFTYTETCYDQAATEYFILQMLSKLNPDSYNLIRLYETVLFDHKPCLVFELLDRSLWDLIGGGSLLSLAEIRPIAQQLLVALVGIKSLGIVHTDLKPENVMLVNHREQPFKVKLIDFGLARPSKIIKPGISLQPQMFRAPEVILGLPVSEAIDMWSLGCLLVFLFLGFVPFPGATEYDVMRFIIDTVGMPEVSLLDSGIKTGDFFERDTVRQSWNFKSPEEYEAATGIKARGASFFFSCLDDIKMMRSVIDNPGDADQVPLDELDESTQGPKQAWKERAAPSQDVVVYEDGEAFINLLQQIFTVDPQKRITPEEALKHPFLTMVHMSGFKESSAHIANSIQAMQVCKQLDDVNIPGSDPSQEDSIPSVASVIKNKEDTKITRLKKFFSRMV